MSSPVKRVENYTTTCLVLVFVNLLWIFAAIWAFFGFGWMLLTGWLLNKGITRLANR